MGREIMFRGKHVHAFSCNKKLDGVWIYGYLADDNYIMSEQGYEKMVDPETVGQYTGLKDKNGKMIFEGDIVECNNGFDYAKGEVVFENGAFGIGTINLIGISECCCDNFASLWQLYWDQEIMDGLELYYCEIIGNIHDNPELLEGK